MATTNSGNRKKKDQSNIVFHKQKTGKLEEPRRFANLEKDGVPAEEKEKLLSKTLCWILRHGALSIGIDMAQNGWVLVDDLLNHSQMKKHNLNCESLADFVQNDKRRLFEFVCEADTKSCWIRSKRGHTIEGIDPRL